MRIYIASVFVVTGLLAAGDVRAKSIPLPEVYPFRIERSASAGQSFSAATGEVIYRETSHGRPAAYLNDAAPGGWPVAVEMIEPLFPVRFADGGRPFVAYCPDRFAAETDWKAPSRRTTCFRDRDGDGRFELMTTGRRKTGFIIEITGHYFESTAGSVAGADIDTFDEPWKSVRALRYRLGLARPGAGDEAVLEVRYAGIENSLPRFEVSVRSASAAKGLSSTVTAHEKAGSLELSHPARSQTATMQISIASATPERVSGMIVRPYSDWVAYGCDRGPQPIKIEKGNLPIVVAGRFGERCVTLTWRDGEFWRTSTPSSESAQYVDPKKQLGAFERPAK